MGHVPVDLVSVVFVSTYDPRFKCSNRKYITLLLFYKRIKNIIHMLYSFIYLRPNYQSKQLIFLQSQ